MEKQTGPFQFHLVFTGQGNDNFGSHQEQPWAINLMGTVQPTPVLWLCPALTPPIYHCGSSYYLAMNGRLKNPELPPGASLPTRRNQDKKSL